MKEFKASVTINAEQEDVWSAFTNALTIELWSGYPAVMGEKEGEEFSLYEGDITGKIIELVPFRKIVQQWYFDDSGKDSLVTVEISPAGSSSKVKVHHINIPDDDFENISEGWKDHIFASIEALFNPNF